MPIDTPVADLVRQLSRVGLRPDERLAQKIVEQGPDARAALLELATDIPAIHSELPASLGPLHALRLLGEVPDVEMIAPLLNGLPIPIINEQDVPARLYATEVLQIIGRVGAPAVPALWAYADDEANSAMPRGAAVSALSFVAAFAPETREAIVDECRRRLALGETGPVTTGVVTVLAELGDTASYKPMMAAYREGRVDKEQAPAAAARQFMLGGGRRDLSCVSHPLFERYDHHGPRFRDPDEVEDDELL
jgi:hypothetical protein